MVITRIKTQYLRTLRFTVPLFFLFIMQAEGQEAPKTNRPPIPIEVMFGNEEIYFLGILNLPFEKGTKLGYFGVASALVPYENARSNNEIVISNSLTYSLSQKWYATAGLQFHYSKGAVPFTGFQFFSANPKWLFLFSPNLQLAPTINFETVGIVEYKPKLSKGLRLYSRFQGIYNQNLDDGAHERSLLYLRAGISLKRTSFGVGLNIDIYGPERQSEQNYGIFINHLF